MPDPDLATPVNPRWADALLSAQILVAGAGLIGGVRLRAGAGPVRDRWLEMMNLMLAARSGKTTPWIRIPSSSATGRLTGGIDITATLTSGRPVHEKGLLARADGGFVVLGMAERLAGASAAIIGSALDDGESIGSSGTRQASRFSIVALDESAGEDENLPSALADRLTLDLRLDGLSIRDAVCDPDLAAALARHLPDAATSAKAMGGIPVGDGLLEAAAAISMALPGSPIRRALDLIRVARILAMIERKDQVDGEHLATAVRLCLGITLNASEQTEAEERPAEADQRQDSEDQPPPPEPPSDEADSDGEITEADMSDADMMVAAAAASRAVLAELDRPDRSMAAKMARTGKSGGFKSGSRRGRPAGIVSRPPYTEARPDVVSTLRAAIPWQRLRNPDFVLRTDGSVPQLRILPSDFRYIRFRHRTESTAIFAVDASGSTAMERLAEAKGAIELLLGDCYVRRDQVALITFRGLTAETLLEPTRSLVRAKRSLTGIPGGGPTPLAGAIRRSLEIAGMVQRRGQSPLIVYLTDGSGNIALDGKPDRVRAREDEKMLARQGAALGYRSILIDISRRPRETTRELARSMQAQYCPLPIVSASAVNAIVSAELQKGPSQGDRQ
ncbi:VWA domain-containing protein [Hoeflea sp.]|uniref:VWA domain-containing protein n=1 Tax=Hoeflea sp. TaxID=1940281 RepID=UPI0019900DC6|nr:VWA domain-containing protein [Hoeflea sp.]MBC7283850.1 magnesium chelatase ATPase subunit D [Hoeflea sp.]